METTKRRTRHLYEKIGRINSKKKRSAKEYPNSYYYELDVDLENDSRLNKIFVLPNKLASETI